MADMAVEQWQVNVAEDGLKAFAASYGLDKNEENGCFNPFDIFRKRTLTSTDSTSSPPKVNVVVDENESCFSMFWVIGKEKANPKPEDLKQPDTVYENGEYQSLDQVEPPKYVTGTSAIAT
nr:membrane protein of ER body 2-like [Tanacetum cinerariifolium]